MGASVSTRTGYKMSMADRLKEMSTPGWQYVKKCGIFFLMIFVFGVAYQVMIGNTPEEWAHPTDENGGSIINGPYAATVICTTVGYGDYYPYSQRGMVLVVFTILISWIVTTSLLS